jgi:NitT/TauT family transport system substrate-binding protein
MMSWRTAVAVGLLLSTLSSGALAESLKVAIPQRGFWDSSFVDFALKEGFFKEAGLEPEIFWTDGGAQTLTAALSGSVDIALSNGTLGVVGAYVKGAPIRIVSAQMTGAHELYWFVKADSPIHSLKDVAEGKTIAFSSPGSSSNLILLSLLRQAQSKAKPVATGGLPATMTQVMTGQIDIGWGVPPFGLQDIADGKIRIIARARDATELRNQTIRVNIAREDKLAARRDTLTRFMRVYVRAVDWAYQNPKAIDYFAEGARVPRAIAEKAVADFYPREALQIGEVRDLDRTLKDALDYKFIPAAKTAKEVEGLFDIIYRPATNQRG